MSTFFIDAETFSKADLKKVGAWKYSEHPSTEILLLAIARDDGPVELWDSRNTQMCLTRAGMLIKEMLLYDDGPIVAHNYSFEQAIFHYRCDLDLDFPPPPLERWICTAAMCRRAAIPWSLKDAAKFLNVPTQKVDAGAGLIKFFSVPTDKVPPPGAWEDFGRYCVADVQCMREIYHRLKKSFSVENEPGFYLDARLNTRGIPVNRDALRAAETMVKGAMETLTAEFRSITGLNPTQRDKVLAWLRERGYPGEDLQSATMEAALEEPMWETSPEAYRALELRAGGSFAALAKIPAMLGCACEDGRIRGAFLWSGALRTHRWSGRLVQPQNMRRATVKDTGLAYEMIKSGASADDLDHVFGEVPEALASCVRHFIELDGSAFLDLDYVAIEARCLPWLMGQNDLVEEFRSFDLTQDESKEPYRIMAGTIFNRRPEEVSDEQRWVGKVALLSAGYGTGWRKFQSMCKKNGRELSDDLCKTVINEYRAKNDMIVQGWWDCDEAAKSAIRSTGKVFKVRGLSFRCGLVAGFKALQVTLPSGHKLTYPLARVAKVTKEFENGKREVEEVQYWGKDQFSVTWCYRSTWGARLVENFSQATAGDFLVHGLLEGEKQGYEPFMVVHDQALCVYDPARHTPEGFERALCTLPPWSPNFPLRAKCLVTPYYRKD